MHHEGLAALTVTASAALADNMIVEAIEAGQGFRQSNRPRVAMSSSICWRSGVVVCKLGWMGIGSS